MAKNVLTMPIIIFHNQAYLPLVGAENHVYVPHIASILYCSPFLAQKGRFSRRKKRKIND